MILINIVKLLVDKGLITEDEAKQVSEFPPAWGTDTSAVADTPQWAGKYIGARYVPKIMGRWSDSIAYEPLMIVQDELGNSFTSKSNVPVGTPLSNTKYWVQTGNYNAQITNIHELLNELNTQLTQEISDRVSGDSELETSIENEITNRENADTSIINSVSVLQALTNELLGGNKIKGRKFLILSDSVGVTTTARTSWTTPFTQLVTKFGGSVVNNSIGSSKISSIPERVAGITATGITDVILIMGVNDVAARTPLVGDNSFLSQYNAALGAILNKFSNRVNIYCGSPMRTTNIWFPSRQWLASEAYYYNMIYQQAKLIGATFIDLFSQAPMYNYASTRNIYTDDGLHPNSAYAPILANFILSRIINGGDEFCPPSLAFTSSRFCTFATGVEIKDGGGVYLENTGNTFKIYGLMTFEKGKQRIPAKSAVVLATLSIYPRHVHPLNCRISYVGETGSSVTYADQAFAYLSSNGNIELYSDIELPNLTTFIFDCILTDYIMYQRQS